MTAQSPRIGIIGTGAIGGFYGLMLARAGFDVHFLLRSEYAAVSEHGLQLKEDEKHARSRPARAQRFVAHVLLRMMPQHAKEDVSAEPQTPGDAERGEQPFAHGLARRKDRVDRREDGDAIGPGDIEQPEIIDPHADRPSEAEIRDREGEADEEERDHRAERRARTPIGWSRAK